jgi:hypothetical protein
LRKNGEAMQLFADGQPFLILGGELHNSSASSLEYMEAIWPRLKAVSLNTLSLRFFSARGARGAWPRRRES